MLTAKRAAMVLAAWWLVVPFAETRFYQHELERGAYPTDADSIGIPIAASVFGWLLLTPLIAWIVWWLVWRGSPARFSWLAFDRGRMTWSIAWTIGLTCFAFAELWSASEATLRSYPLDVITSCAGAAAALAARAGLCAPRSPDFDVP